MSIDATSATDDPTLAPGPADVLTRAQMVRVLTDIVVLPAARISSNERLVAGDLLIQILGDVTSDLRVEIARRISRVAEAPVAVLRQLLLDEPAVAVEVLKSDIALPQALLAEAARMGQRPLREQLARRQDLSTSIADAILEFREPDVAKLLLRREELTLSPAAIDLLVAMSAVDHDMQTLLLRRRELEPAHGFVMFWWVDKAARRRILQRYAMNRTTLQDSFQELYPSVYADPSPDPVVKEVLIFLDRRHRPRGANGEIVTMDVVRKTLSYARRHPEQEAIVAVSLIAGVGRELAARILRDQGGEPFAVICKAVGLSRDDFFAIASYADEDAKERLLEVFDSMSRDFSRAMLRYWDWRGNPRILRMTQLLEASVQ